MEQLWIDICRTGNFRDRFGRDVELTEDDFERMVAQHNPTERGVPAVIGHPTLNSPAYGWVKSLRRKGDRLQAQFGDVVHEFAEGVRKKMWPERSIKFDSQKNLIHVGFLGAAPPAVPGLAAIEFSEDDDGYVVEFELADWRMPTVGELFRRLREWILSEKDMETADRIIPQESLTDLADRMDEIPEWFRNTVDDHERRLRHIEEPEVQRPQEFSTAMNSETTTTAASAPTNSPATTQAPATAPTSSAPPTTAATQQEPQRNEADLLERQRLLEENARLRQTIEMNEFSAFLDGPEMSERVTPGMREGAIEIFRALCSGPETFEFSSGGEQSPVTRISRVDRGVTEER